MAYVFETTPRMQRNFLRALAVVALMSSSSGMALAYSSQAYDHNSGNQDSHNRNQGNEAHKGWAQDRGGDYQYQRGERMGYNDWNGSPVVDYRTNHLRRPRAGYEWREHNGKYVMVAIATGLIASVILNPH